MTNLNLIVDSIFSTFSKIVHLYNSVWLFGLAFSIWLLNFVIDRFQRLKHK